MYITYEEYVVIIDREMGVEVSDRDSPEQIRSTIAKMSLYISSQLWYKFDPTHVDIKTACALGTYYELDEDDDETSGKNIIFNYLVQKEWIVL